MAEYTLNDFGVLDKTCRKPRDGIEKGGDILHEFGEDYGPIKEYSELLKNNKISGSYEDFQKDYAWLESHIKTIANYMHREHGIDQINMSAYFVVLKGDDHDCVQINFPYENTVLNYHCNGPDFAQFFTSTISGDISHKKGDLVETYFKKLVEAIPDHQLKHINWIIPKFISNYALDADPHLTIEMEFDYDAIKKENCGIYAHFFVQKRKKFPFFPFQPVFAGENEETAVIILPKEDLFNVEEFRKEIAEKTGINKNKIKLDKRYDLKVAIEDLKYSVGLRTLHDIRIEHRNLTEISDSLLAKDFLYRSQQGLRCAQKCATSDYTKGKDFEGMEEGLLKRIIDSYQNPSFVNIPSAIFGPPDDLDYFGDQLRKKGNNIFMEYKKERLGL